MYRYMVEGCLVDNGVVIPFVTITPPCENAYQAALYTEGKYHDYDLQINHDVIARILE